MVNYLPNVIIEILLKTLKQKLTKLTKLQTVPEKFGRQSSFLRWSLRTKRNRSYEAAGSVSARALGRWKKNKKKSLFFGCRCLTGEEKKILHFFSDWEINFFCSFSVFFFAPNNAAAWQMEKKTFLVTFHLIMVVRVSFCLVPKYLLSFCPFCQRCSLFMKWGIC